MNGNLLVLLSLLVPLVVAFFARVETPSWAKGLTAFGLSLAVGVVSVFFGDVQSIELYAGYVVAVIAAAQSSYQMLWKPLGVTSWILEHLGRVNRPE